MRKILFFISVIILVSSNYAVAQRFKAAAIVGVNASQIDGDNLHGFDKLGLSVGARLSYTNDKIFDYALEMLYSQRGSAVRFFNNDAGDKINLNYIELPFVVSLRDWYIEDKGYYKVRAEGGLSYGYLFSFDSQGFDDSFLRTSDVSWLIGAGINFNKTLGLSIRYTSSFLDMYNDPKDEIVFKSYFVTIRTEINF